MHILSSAAAHHEARFSDVLHVKSSQMAARTLRVFLLLLALFFSSKTTTQTTTTNERERQILLQIKSYWGNLQALTSWNDSTAIPHCNWTGIQCSTNGMVNNITLANKDIHGIIPPAICDLQSLSVLNLTQNYINGSFPTFLYNCSSLEYLDLSENVFTGVIPSDAYRLSPRLTHLILSSNNFAGDIPPSIGRLPAIQELWLDTNLFNGPFPAELGNLSTLQTLTLAYNLFVPASIPSEFGNLTRLRFLWMTRTNLKGGIPDFFGNLMEMVRLDLGDNSLSGSIPSGLWMLKNLQKLRLYMNNLDGEININGTIGALSLREIDVSSNQLNGPIPKDFGKLQNLSLLAMHNNRLSGEIPSGIALLPKLTTLWLYKNILSGVLPPELGKHSELRYVEVDDNKISGELPYGICASGALSWIVVSRNNLTGKLPATLGDCPTLNGIAMEENKFSSDVPAGMWSAVNLTAVFMQDNALSGTLPDKLSLKLVLIQIQNNQFSGTLPENLPPKLTLMQLQNNQFSGTLPNKLPPEVVYLEIQNNKFSGTLPDKLPAKLVWLDIENNRFSGNIPSTAKSLQFLSASNNLLSGEIPIILIGIPELRMLYLGGNHISGQIPTEISNLKFLSVLNLSSNHLVGEIPAAIGSLWALTSLDLSTNQLSGSIPPEVGELKLNTLNLSSNRLSGEIPTSLQNVAYNQSFLSNPNLCAFTEILNVHTCKHGSNGLCWELRVTLIALASLVFFIAIAFAVYMARARRGGRSDDGRDPSAWTTMFFYQLDFAESTILDGLTDDSLIGRGGGGKVYRIMLENPVRQMVAVKKIWNDKKLDSLLEKEFQSEIQILGSIRHANIVKLFGCLWNADTKLLVYEYMENGSLEWWLHKKKRRVVERDEEMDSNHIHLDWSTRLQIAIDVARGLCYMHHDCPTSIVHRDVKSSNILLDSKFRAKIADFGLARMLVNVGELNTVSAVAGTFGYMAPECAYSRKINEKMDVYSFGVLLLELVTAKKAHDGEEYSNLAEWAWRCLQIAEKMNDAIHHDIKDPTYEEEIAVVFKLGVMCTSPLPSTRPTIKEALQILLRCEQAAANIAIA